MLGLYIHCTFCIAMYYAKHIATMSLTPKFNMVKLIYSYVARFLVSHICT